MHAERAQGRGRDCVQIVGGTGHAGGGGAHDVNTQAMLVTRDVSQLRGWLKAYANCRGAQAGHTVRGERCGPVAERGGCTAV